MHDIFYPSDDDADLTRNSPALLRDEDENHGEDRTARQMTQSRKRKRCTLQKKQGLPSGAIRIVSSEEDTSETTDAGSRNNESVTFNMRLPLCVEQEMKYRKAGTRGRPTMKTGAQLSMNFMSLNYKRSSAHKFHQWFSGPCFEDIFRGRRENETLRFHLSDMVNHVASTVRMFTSEVCEDTIKSRLKPSKSHEMHLKEDSGKRQSDRIRQCKDYLVSSSSSSSISSDEQEQDFSSVPHSLFDDDFRTSGMPTADSEHLLSARVSRFVKLDRIELANKKYVFDGKEFSMMDPIIILYNGMEFTYPLVALVVRIAGSICRYTTKTHGPIGVRNPTDENCCYGSPFEYRCYPEMQIETSIRFSREMTKKAKQKRIRTRITTGDQSEVRYEATSGFEDPDPEVYGNMVRYIREFLCDDDAIAYTLVETWLAEMLFNPRVKYPICPVFSGPESSGKKKFLWFVSEYLLGSDLVRHVHLDRFYRQASFENDNVLLIVGESKWCGKKRSGEEWKAFLNLVTLCSKSNVHQNETIRTTNHHQTNGVYQRSCILVNETVPDGLVRPGDNSISLIQTSVSGSRFLDQLLEPGKSLEIAEHFAGYLQRLRQVTKSRFSPAGDLHLWERTDGWRKLGIPEAFVHPDLKKVQTCYTQNNNRDHSTFVVGYDPEILNERPLTRVMRLRTFDCMQTYHHFLYMFLIKKLPLTRLVSPDFRKNHVTVEKALRTTPEEHYEQVGDLHGIKADYFDNAFGTFMKAVGECKDLMSLNTNEYCGPRNVPGPNEGSGIRENDVLAQVKYFVEPYNNPVADQYDSRFRSGRGTKGESIMCKMAHSAIANGTSETSQAYLREYSGFSLNLGKREGGLIFVTPDGITTTRSFLYGVYRRDVRGLTGEEETELYYNFSGVVKALTGIYGGEYGILRDLKEFDSENVSSKQQSIRLNPEPSSRIRSHPVQEEGRIPSTTSRSNNTSTCASMGLNDTQMDDVEIVEVYNSKLCVKPGARAPAYAGQRKNQQYWGPVRKTDLPSVKVCENEKQPMAFESQFAAFGAGVFKQIGPIGHQKQ